MFRCLAPMLIACMLAGGSMASDDPQGPIRIQPHPGVGRFKAKRDPDKPILGFYGGIGLYQRPDGGWTGYAQRSEEDVRYLIRRLAENGITRAYVNFQEEDYPSQIGPSSPPGAPDYIRVFCELAHQNNIEVYGQFPCFATNEVSKCRAFAAAHPEMFTRHLDGTPHPYMLSPAWPEVRRIKRRLLMEYVQNYPLDGLVLDFVRYPCYVVGYGSFGYDEPALKRFREQYGYDESYVPAIDDPRWLALKADYVTQFIREVRADMAASGVSLPLGAFNYTSGRAVGSYRNVHQDAFTWVKEGLLEEHVPMLVMTGGMCTLVKQAHELLRIRRPDSTFLGPIFLAEWPTIEQGGIGQPTPQAVRDAARRLIKVGCDGVWFCRAQEIEEFGLWPVVREISEWSVSKIRAEDFDPFYENNLVNGSFESTDAAEGWTITPDGAAAVASSEAVHDGRQALRVRLSPDGVTVVSQQVRFVPVSYLGVDSLAFSVWVNPRGAQLTGAIELQIDLRYADGTQERLDRSAPTPDAGWTELRQVVKVGCDFNRHLLKTAEARIVLPPGRGEIILDHAELLRDPLLDGRRDP